MNYATLSTTSSRVAEATLAESDLEIVFLTLTGTSPSAEDSAVMREALRMLGIPPSPQRNPLPVPRPVPLPRGVSARTGDDTGGYKRIVKVA